jgi:hypothetical protein
MDRMNSKKVDSNTVAKKISLIMKPKKVFQLFCKKIDVGTTPQTCNDTSQLGFGA